MHQQIAYAPVISDVPWQVRRSGNTTMSLTTGNIPGNQKDRMMNGNRCRGNTLPALHRTSIMNSEMAKKVYLSQMTGAVKGEHIPALTKIRSETRSDIRSHIPGGIVTGGDA
jgi:hypothetical protein